MVGDALARLVIRDAREGDAGHLDRNLACRELRLARGRHVGPDRSDEVLEDHHDVLLVLDEGDLAIDRRRLVEVTRRVVALGAEVLRDLEDAVKAGAHEHLLVELGRLREERLALEVLHREDLGTALARCADDVGRVDLGEALAAQVLARTLEDR